jgi:Ig-like domain from next to BRCA1 gene
MQKYIYKTMVAILVTLMAASCGGAAPTQDVNAVMTSAVSTMVASFFGTQTAMVTPATVTSTQTNTPLPTNTPYNTVTPLATSTYVYVAPLITLGSVTPTGTRPTATINAAAVAVGCNNLFFIRDVTIPPGTVMQKNQDFTKTWKVQNNGTCDWLYQYIFSAVSPDTFGAGAYKIQKLVKAGNWTELSVHMKAPNTLGTYSSSWRMSNGNGPFGATLVVSFVVANPPTSTAIPSITNTSAPLATNTFTLVPTYTLTVAPTDTPTEAPTPTSTP